MYSASTYNKTEQTQQTLHTPVKSKSCSWHESILLRLLASMPRGQLQMIFPDGSKRFFGQQPQDLQATIRIRNPVMFKKVFLYGDVGFGESYVDGDWDTDNISNVIAWFILNVQYWPTISGTQNKKRLISILDFLNRAVHLFRSNTLSGSTNNIRQHYDLSNDFFKLFLDPTMTYSSAYFESENQNLEMAQIAKYDRLCKKLKIQPTDHLLEIGTGWGGFSIHTARKYRCKITTVTISKQQFEYASEKIQKEQLNDRIQVQLTDYRHIQGKFDKIVSIEMLEAVGHKFLKTYFSKCQQVLNPAGLMGLQFITCPDQRYDSLRKGVDWIQKHIFPGSLLLSLNHVNHVIQKTGELVLYNLEDMGSHYAQTLAKWSENFNGAIPQVQALGLDQKFIRKWNYYLSYCHAAFKMRNISVVQAIYTRPNNDPTTCLLAFSEQNQDRW